MNRCTGSAASHMDGMVLVSVVLDQNMNTLIINTSENVAHFFSWFSWLIEPYSTFFLINLSLYNVGPEPSILSGPNGGEPSKIR